jgi:hypothetical protein
MGVLVYDTKKSKYYEVHPTMGADKTWLAQRGLIVQAEPKVIQATNMPPANDAGIEDVKPTNNPTTTKTK